eukprot:963365-Rhodomonas_salina.1
MTSAFCTRTLLQWTSRSRRRCNLPVPQPPAAGQRCPNKAGIMTTRFNHPTCVKLPPCTPVLTLPAVRACVATPPRPRCDPALWQGRDRSNFETAGQNQV